MEKKTQKLYEEVADRLLGQIQSGVYQQGDRLPAERILSKEYGVSRSVIREAFRFLERMGCVEARVGGGTYVKAPEISDVVDPLAMLFSQDADFVLELVEARLILETEIAKLAAVRRTDAQVRELHKILDDMRANISHGGRGIEQDARFHTQLAQSAGNRALNLMSASCSEVLNRSMEMTQMLEGVPAQALKAHEDILDAVERHDGEGARHAMRAHLLSADENLRKAFADRKENMEK